MGIKSARFRGKVRIKGRPKEQARAELMIMKEEARQKERERRRRLFNLLDGVIIFGFLLAFYSIWIEEYLNAFLFFLIGSAPLIYFIFRRKLRDKAKRVIK